MSVEPSNDLEAPDEAALFLCYNSRDRSQVAELAAGLRAAGEAVWFDNWVSAHHSHH